MTDSIKKNSCLPYASPYLPLHSLSKYIKNMKIIHHKIIEISRSFSAMQLYFFFSPYPLPSSILPLYIHHPLSCAVEFLLPVLSSLHRSKP